MEWTDMDGDLRVSLDRIEEGIAVLMTRDSSRWLIPEGYLPEGTVEGDILRVFFERDQAATELQADRIRELQQRLLDRTSERYEEE
jgi:hypothetical protein